MSAVQETLLRQVVVFPVQSVRLRRDLAELEFLGRTFVELIGLRSLRWIRDFDWPVQQVVRRLSSVRGSDSEIQIIERCGGIHGHRVAATMGAVDHSVEVVRTERIVGRCVRQQFKPRSRRGRLAVVDRHCAVRHDERCEMFGDLGRRRVRKADDRFSEQIVGQLTVSGLAEKFTRVGRIRLPRDVIAKQLREDGVQRSAFSHAVNCTNTSTAAASGTTPYVPRSAITTEPWERL